MSDCRIALVEVAADMDELPKTFGLPDYRSTFGCLACFQASACYHDLNAPFRKRRHQWLLDTAESSFSFHDVADDGVECLKANCKARKKKVASLCSAICGLLFLT